MVSLNVKADNAAAIAVYERLGFTPVADYDEVAFATRDTPVTREPSRA